MLTVDWRSLYMCANSIVNSQFLFFCTDLFWYGNCELKIGSAKISVPRLQKFGTEERRLEKCFTRILILEIVIGHQKNAFWVLENRNVSKKLFLLPV